MWGPRRHRRRQGSSTPRPAKDTCSSRPRVRLTAYFSISQPISRSISKHLKLRQNCVNTIVNFATAAARQSGQSEPRQAGCFRPLRHLAQPRRIRNPLKPITLGIMNSVLITSPKFGVPFNEPNRHRHRTMALRIEKNGYRFGSIYLLTSQDLRSKGLFRITPASPHSPEKPARVQDRPGNWSGLNGRGSAVEG